MVLRGHPDAFYFCAVGVFSAVEPGFSKVVLASAVLSGVREMSRVSVMKTVRGMRFLRVRRAGWGGVFLGVFIGGTISIFFWAV